MNTDDHLHIRDAVPGDRDTIRDVIIASFAQYATTLSTWDMYREYLLTTFDQDRTAERLVAEKDGMIIGSVFLFPAKPPGDTNPTRGPLPEVGMLAVAPEARGQGVGNALLDECLRRARRAGGSTIGLHTMDVMGGAVRLYERRGFVRAPEGDWSPTEDVLVKWYHRSLDDVEITV